MKSFLTKTGLYSVILIIFIIAAIILTLYIEPYEKLVSHITCSTEYDASEEIGKIEEIEKTQTPGGYTKLIVDDSVCASMFKRLQDKNDVYLFAGTNRAFSFPGFYIQIKEFLKNNEHVDDVYIFVGKETWETTLDPQYGYHCLILPLVYTDTFYELETGTIDYARGIYGKILTNKNFVNAYMRSSVIRKLTLNLLLEYHEKILHEDMSAPFLSTKDQVSPLCKTYFENIVDICAENNVSLHIICDPMRDTEDKYKEYENLKKMIRNIETPDTKDLLEDYLKTQLYYPADDFLDGVHFKGDDDLNDSVIMDISEISGLLDDINL